MRHIERFELIERIGRILQGRMTYAEIDSYLPMFGVEIRETSEVNSKRIHVQELLSDQPEEVILRIADELGIDHGFTQTSRSGQSVGASWRPSYFRLFVSHVAADKIRAKRLQESLLKHGIYGFVAHEDIEPAADWQDEIEKALLSMDALVAILSPGFHESSWTDQEVGAAVGRDVLAIAIRNGVDPYGFIGRFQGLPGIDKSIGDVSGGIARLVQKHNKTRGRMTDCLVNLLLSADTEEEGLRWVGQLVEAKPSRRHVESLVQGVPGRSVLADSARIVHAVNRMADSHGIATIERLVEDVWGASISDTPF